MSLHALHMSGCCFFFAASRVVFKRGKIVAHQNHRGVFSHRISCSVNCRTSNANVCFGCRRSLRCPKCFACVLPSHPFCGQCAQRLGEYLPDAPAIHKKILDQGITMNELRCGMMKVLESATLGVYKKLAFPASPSVTNDEAAIIVKFALRHVSTHRVRDCALELHWPLNPANVVSYHEVLRGLLRSMTCENTPQSNKIRQSGASPTGEGNLGARRGALPCEQWKTVHRVDEWLLEKGQPTVPERAGACCGHVNQRA